MTLDSKILGEEIKRMRKTKGMTQADLANGICTQATVSGIESGRTFPSIDILYYLSLRLQVSMDYFLEKITFRQEQYVNDTYAYINGLIKKNNFQELLELTEFELKRTSGYKDESLELYLKWQHTISSYELKRIDWESCVHKLLNLLKTNHYSIKQQFMNIKIKNSLGNVLAKNEEYSRALDIFKEILDEEVNMDGYHRMKLKVLFNISKVYYEIENYRESHQYAMEGIKYSLVKADMSNLGPLYVQAGQSLYRMGGAPEKSMELYENALFLFRLFDQESHMKVVKKLVNMLKNKA
ncbi:helix-turn-helix transcriptional regulator [Sutcliffiella horikoshii]|uniref:helix-turn-helix domain-containing protein n=1 Tax=Sutcliffiella horikoshii TaxID=79883 RepID=UPI00203BF5E7|nr:helix-turn-helix transcriptional regulator [Sutcliffiella horikoshii]